MNGKRWYFGAALFATLTVSSAGCVDCVTGSNVAKTICQSSGKGQVESPDGVVVQPTLGTFEGNCSSDTCDFSFSSLPSSRLMVEGAIRLPDITAPPPFTVDLAQNRVPPVALFGLASTTTSQDLTIISGQVTVTSGGHTRLVAIFSATLETAAGERLVITGNVKVDNCHLEEMCTY